MLQPGGEGAERNAQGSFFDRFVQVGWISAPSSLGVASNGGCSGGGQWWMFKALQLDPFPPFARGPHDISQTGEVPTIVTRVAEVDGGLLAVDLSSLEDSISHRQRATQRSSNPNPLLLLAKTSDRFAAALTVHHMPLTPLVRQARPLWGDDDDMI